MTGLERLRLDALLSPEQLGERAKVAPGTIRRIEAGKTTTVRTLAKLSQFFHVPASALLRPAAELPERDAA